MDKLKIQFGADLLAKTLGLPDNVEILGVEYNPMGNWNNPTGTHVTVLIGGENLPTERVTMADQESLEGLCKEFFNDKDE